MFVKEFNVNEDAEFDNVETSSRHLISFMKGARCSCRDGESCRKQVPSLLCSKMVHIKKTQKEWMRKAYYHACCSGYPYGIRAV